VRRHGPRWSGYVVVDDVDAEVVRVQEAGGIVHAPPQDIPTVGRFAVVADPQGAPFKLITPMPREAPSPVPAGTPGHVGWRELHTSDWPAAFAFYSGRFGWTKDRAFDMGPMGVYQIFAVDGEPAGGMMNSPLPKPTWLFYVNVADIDAARTAIEAGGGSVTYGPSEVPGGALIVQASDPQGAMFAVVGPRRQ
jgi:predicted enzyme related to lactoylglutathione lyase